MTDHTPEHAIDRNHRPVEGLDDRDGLVVREERLVVGAAHVEAVQVLELGEIEPRRRAADGPGDADGSGGAGGSGRAAEQLSPSDRSLDWQHRRGLAFADLLMRIPTDHLHSKVSATMLITTRVDDLLADGGETAP